MCEPLTIQTRAEFMKKINRKAPDFMKTHRVEHGW